MPVVYSPLMPIKFRNELLQSGFQLLGYEPQVGFLGRNNFNGGLAPSLGFVFGSQV